MLITLFIFDNALGTLYYCKIRRRPYSSQEVYFPFRDRLAAIERYREPVYLQLIAFRALYNVERSIVTLYCIKSDKYLVLARVGTPPNFAVG